MFYFNRQNTSCIRKLQVILGVGGRGVCTPWGVGGGGWAPPSPPPPPPRCTLEAKERLCWQNVLWDDPRSAFIIQHHCDLNSPKEPLNPIWTKEYITLSFLVFTTDTTIFGSKTYHNSLSCFKSGRLILIIDKSGRK